MPNNFQTAISDKDLQRKALLSFKDEYLLDFVNIESPDDEPDERVLESGIVSNIRKFIMSLGKDFSFIGNQYRLIVDEIEKRRRGCKWRVPRSIMLIHTKTCLNIAFYKMIWHN